MAVSIWFLYIGVFLCASGIGIVVGAIFIAFWGIKTLEESKQGHSYTENNFTANIDHYHADDNGSNNDDSYTSARREDVSRAMSQRPLWRKADDAEEKLLDIL